MKWLSAVLETALVYKCIKHGSARSRSLFAPTGALWPWF
jgi:hypothetical protein